MMMNFRLALRQLMRAPGFTLLPLAALLLPAREAKNLSALA